MHAYFLNLEVFLFQETLSTDYFILKQVFAMAS